MTYIYLDSWSQRWWKVQLRHKLSLVLLSIEFDEDGGHWVDCLWWRSWRWECFHFVGNPKMISDKVCTQGSELIDVDRLVPEMVREAIVTQIKDFLWNHFIKWRPPPSIFYEVPIHFFSSIIWAKTKDDFGGCFKGVWRVLQGVWRVFEKKNK